MIRAALLALRRALDAKRESRVRAAFAAYAQIPTGLPGEAAAKARGVPAFLRRQTNGTVLPDAEAGGEQAQGAGGGLSSPPALVPAHGVLGGQER